MLYNTNQTVNTLTEYYSDNESGYGGYFPVGINNTWHSGIHINDMKKIFPFRPGELVAYNICEEYVQTSWPKYITSTIYDKLSDDNKKLFRKKLFGGYELIDDAIEHCSNSFVLLKHTVLLHTRNNSKKEFSFFTLYMNLMPLKGNSELCEYYNTYTQIQSDLQQEPFYTEWKFKLTDTNGLGSIYKYNKGTNLFANSEFKIAKQTFAYTVYKNLTEASDLQNQQLPAAEITFLAPNSSCTDTIPLSDVELWNEVIIIPAETEFEVYRNGHLGGKIGTLRFSKKLLFIADEELEATDTSGKDIVRYLRFNFSNILDFTNNIICYIRCTAIDTAYKAESDGYYRYASTDYENTRPFLDIAGTMYEAYENDFFKIQNNTDTVIINGIECCQASIEVKESEIYEIKATDDIKIALEGKLKKTEENATNFTKITDCLVCYTDRTKSNPAEIKTGGVEFIPQDSQYFRDIDSTHSGYVRFDSDQYYYIDIPAGKMLQAKLIVKNGYTINENTNVPDGNRVNITAEDLLGYPALCEETNKTYFDLVVFSTQDLSCFEDGESSFYKKNFVKYKEGSNKDEDSHKKDLFVEPKKFRNFFNDSTDYKLISQIDQNIFLCFGKNGKISEKELLQFFTSQEEDVKKSRENFYKLICEHPLEWDAQFCQQKIQEDYEKVFGEPCMKDFIEAWAKNLSEKLTKLSVFEKGFKHAVCKEAAESAAALENIFYFMHPLYFLEKVHEDEGDAEEDKKFLPKEAADLIEIQNYVIALECLKKGNTGIYLSEMRDGQTYCNHAVFLTVIAADSNYTAFTNRNGTQFPEADSEKDNVKNKEIEKTHEPDYFYYYKASNYWCDILAAASKNESTGIKEVNLEQAQKLANQGYVVIACKKKTAFQTGSPHFATIRPNAAVTHYTIDDVSVANVGNVNKVMTVHDAFIETDTVKYYYNSRQMFQKDMIKWNDIRCGLYKAEET